jgi:ribosomal-protein-alanine N-acetyltransferase
MTNDGTPVPIRTERLILRDFVIEDLDDTMAVVGDPEVTRSLSFDTKTRTEQRGLLTEQIARAQQLPRSEYYLAITGVETGGLLGFVRLGLGPHKSAKLGYALRRSAWGKGYATEAAHAIVCFGFTHLDLHRVTAACGPDNLASIRVAEKLGFSFEGHLRDHVFTNGNWRDSQLYSLLVTDPSCAIT